MKIHKNNAVLWACFVFGFYSSFLQAATSIASEEAAILSQIQMDGAAPLLVTIQNVTDLGNISSTQFQQESKIKYQLLLSELGSKVWQAGIDESSLLPSGTVNLYVTSTGFNILKKSNNAEKFSFISDALIAPHRTNNGSDNALRQVFANQGFVDAVVTVNVEGLVYDIHPDGRFTFTVKTGQIQEFETKANQLLQSFLPQEVIDTTAARKTIAQVVSGNVPFDPRITVRVNMQGAVRLGASQDVRALTPKGFISTVPRQFDQSLLTIATSNGTAPTTIVLHDTMNCYCLSSASRTEQDNAQTRIMEDILAKGGLQGVQRVYYDWNWGGWNLTHSQLERLQAMPDDRIASIARAQPYVPTPALPGSSATQPNSSPPAPDLTSPTVIANTSAIATAVDAVLNWAESQPAAASLGKPSHPISQTGGGYRFRYYPASNSYLGVNETGIPKVYYLGDMSSQKLLDLGYLTDFLLN
mgnify:FL=1|jgi:hypothetical protein